MEFLRLFSLETGKGPDYLTARAEEMVQEQANSGLYHHTTDELVFGARVAWRNSARCIGRLVWESLVVRDCRQINTAEDVYQECLQHLRLSTNGGCIIPMITIFPANGPRIDNSQLLRYADDPSEAERVQRFQEQGWRFRGERFELMPLSIHWPGQRSILRKIPPEVVLEVKLSHPEQPRFRELGLKWHALPALSNLSLEIGALQYDCCPFSGWYLATEIGARNLSDRARYNLLAEVADIFGLDRSHDQSLWRDRALVELNRAVLHSFAEAGVSLVDHHTASRQFLRHCQLEKAKGRQVSAEWSWIVPPMSGSLTEVFHCPMKVIPQTPRFCEPVSMRRPSPT